MNLLQMILNKMKSASKSRNSRNVSGSTSDPSEPQVSRFLENNVNRIKDMLGNSSDLVVRTFTAGERNARRIAILYMEGISDDKTVLQPLVTLLHEQYRGETHWPEADLEDFLQRLFIPVGTVKKENLLHPLVISILSGDIAVFLDGSAYAVTAGARKWKERAIEEPNAEPAVRGPRDGFTETLRTNTAMIRRRIKTPDLWLETISVGKQSHTDVALMYINGVVNPGVVEEARKRLKAIDIDGILESGYIEEFISDKTLTVFPMVYTSERPDVIAAELMEGRAAILVDGTPFVLVVPAMFVQFLQAAEDHYQPWIFASFIRTIRYASLFITLLAPALYVAIITFQQEVLPPELLMSLAAAREGVPFPAFVEAMLMEIIFEILREAGLRMPKTIGQAVSIVGTLVIGQAAVEAGLVSPAMVIIVALTAISNFVIPAYPMAISFRLMRFFMMLLAGSLGIFGILLGLFIMVFHLCSLRSFGLPYLAAFAPFHPLDQKDVILRVPRWMMLVRPHYTKNRNYVRESGKGKPS